MTGMDEPVKRSDALDGIEGACVSRKRFGSSLWVQKDEGVLDRGAGGRFREQRASSPSAELCRIDRRLAQVLAGRGEDRIHHCRDDGRRSIYGL